MSLFFCRRGREAIIQIRKPGYIIAFVVYMEVKPITCNMKLTAKGSVILIVIEDIDERVNRILLQVQDDSTDRGG